MLSFEKMGDGPPLIFLHGLFGSKDNLKSIASSFSDRYTCVLVDLRNHGESFFHDDHSYLSQANDLYSLMKLLQLDSPIIIGHSMGGKVALTFESVYKCSKSIFLMDILPVDYGDKHSFIFDALEPIILSEYKSYSQVREALSLALKDDMLAQFFLKSIRRHDGAFCWKLNLEVLKQFYEQIRQAPPIQKIDCPVVCIYGEKSSYVTSSRKESVESYFSSISYLNIENAGHWVHVDNRDAVIEAINKSI